MKSRELTQRIPLIIVWYFELSETNLPFFCAHLFWYSPHSVIWS